MAAISSFQLTATPLVSLRDIPKEMLSLKVQKSQALVEEMLKQDVVKIGEAPITVGPIPGNDRTISGDLSESAEVFSERLLKYNLVPAPSIYLVGLFFEHSEVLARRMRDFTFIEVFDFRSSFIEEGKVRQLCIRRTKDGVILDVSPYIGNSKVNYLGGISPKVVRGIFFEPWRHKALARSEGPDMSHLATKMIG